MNIEPTGKIWRLMVFNVPDSMGGLMARLGFRPTKANPANWWRTYNPHTPSARETAKSTLDALNEADLKSRRWDKVEQKSSRPAFRGRAGGYATRRQAL